MVEKRNDATQAWCGLSARGSEGRRKATTAASRPVYEPTPVPASDRGSRSALSPRAMAVAREAMEAWYVAHRLCGGRFTERGPLLPRASKLYKRSTRPDASQLPRTRRAWRWRGSILPRHWDKRCRAPSAIRSLVKMQPRTSRLAQDEACLLELSSCVISPSSCLIREPQTFTSPGSKLWPGCPRVSHNINGRILRFEAPRPPGLFALCRSTAPQEFFWNASRGLAASFPLSPDSAEGCFLASCSHNGCIDSSAEGIGPASEPVETAAIRPFA